jgi:DNA gyrase/topoisomerase IV subunit B
MYIGTTGRHGLTEMVLEVLANVVDQALAGGVSSISVTLHGDGRAIVADDGPGLPLPLVDRLLTEPDATASANGQQSHVQLTAGLGLAVVGMLCEELSVEVRREDGHYRAVVRRGELVAPLERTGDADGTTGTTIHLRPDPSIFETTRWDVGAIHEHIRTLAALVRGVAVDFHAEASFPAVGNLGSMFKDRFTWYQPVGPVHLAHREDEASCEMALGWYPNNRHYEPDLSAFCNFREMREGGSAFDGVEAAFIALYGPSAAGALLSGLKGVVHVQLGNPELSGPTKARLDDPAAQSLIERTITTHLPTALTTDPACHAEVQSRLAALQAVTPDP